MVFFRQRAPVACVLACLAATPQALLAQPVPTVAAAAPAAPVSPLETFEAAWRVLKDNHVARTASGVDLDALAAELRPRAAKATSDAEVRAVIREMLDRVGQSHFAILPAPVASAMTSSAVGPADVGTLGFDVRLIDNALVVSNVDAGGPADRAGVRPGWTLARVGVRPVEASLSDLGEGPAHARRFRAWALGTSLLRGRSGEQADLGFIDGAGLAVTRQVVRAPERGQAVKLGHLPTLFARLDQRRVQHGPASVGVIAFNVWMTPISRQFDEAVDALRDTNGIVIDLRGNPGGVLTMVMGLSGHFVESPLNLGTITTRDSSLKLVANPRTVGASGQPVKPFAGPIAVLVDEGSYSASEIFSGGMQSIRRARVFGTRTAGGALPAVLEKLPGGDVLQYAIGDFVTATGDRIEGQGVVPDTAVTPSRVDLLAGRDPVLEAALDWIVKGHRSQ
jgi:carboxyl-terminal processing protease